MKPSKFVLVIHGGAGTILKSQMTPDLEFEYRTALSSSLLQGYKILSSGGSALDSVTSAIKFMEDSPLFNAGKGSVFSSEGLNEMDASIMEGKTLNAGSVSCVRTIKNPIVAALKVLQNSDHVMLMGEGADRFARLQGCEIVDPSYFFTEKRWKQFEKIQKTQKTALDHNTEAVIKQIDEKKFGTVGAVALDLNGNLAAGTSTGGLTNKKFGRVGDSPIIGAGNYANNKTCAISCTGTGEYFIRTLAAFDVSAMMEYKNLGLNEAAEFFIKNKFAEIGGDGGLIGLDAMGNITMPFNTEGMYRGFIREDGSPNVLFYKD